ncbi:hypothetical protein [Falsirhodobacter halotolerans]|uniref:hypothetical protein n=1 Tax=Falsirhodobacter halotolerans TaxID=1146892 RepID=UPI001FD0FF05|nr:hypothetical protein [Falsirhodobacter halotolerans]MCJ8140087.1 hypothetical protein [Falsirhodobacter halotolerans]
MTEIHQTLILPTRLGILSFRTDATGPSLVDSDISLRSVGFTPKLPSGMSTSTCTAVLLQTRPDKDIRTLNLHAELAAALDSNRCTGEFVDALEWNDEQNLVIVGTEHDDALYIRYPDAGYANVASVKYGLQSMKIEFDLDGMPPGVSFHMIVAENPIPEPMEASAWFAVEQRHKDVLQLFS